MHAPSGIRTHDLSKQAAVDLRLRPRVYWDRLPYYDARSKQHQILLDVFGSLRIDAVMP
jgi:hypothetical protein